MTLDIIVFELTDLTSRWIFIGHVIVLKCTTLTIARKTRQLFA